MNNISPELLAVGGIGLAILVLLILVKFGKQILTVLLVVGGLIVVGLLVYGWTQIQKPDLIPSDTRDTVSDVADIARVLAPKDAPVQQPSQPVYSAPAYSAPTGTGWFCAGAMGTLLAIGGCVGAYIYVRLKILPQKPKQARHPDIPVIYIVGDSDEYDDTPVGFEEEWSSGLFQ